MEIVTRATADLRYLILNSLTPFDDLLPLALDSILTMEGRFCAHGPANASQVEHDPIHAQEGWGENVKRDEGSVHHYLSGDNH